MSPNRIPLLLRRVSHWRGRVRETSREIDDENAKSAHGFLNGHRCSLYGQILTLCQCPDYVVTAISATLLTKSRKVVVPTNRTGRVVHEIEMFNALAFDYLSVGIRSPYDKSNT